jgi:hypothetical protein
MNSEPIHRTDGIPLSEWINQLPAELPVDAVGLWQFVPEAREEFGFADEELIACVERAIHALLAHGARPVIGGAGTQHFWIEQTHYGTQPDEIVGNIIAEWRGWGLGNPTVSGLWFALPELFG